MKAGRSLFHRGKMRAMKTRFLAWCRWLSWGTWEFGRGIDIDQDGGVDGTGWMIRFEIPSWLRAWARRRLPQPTEEEMRFMRQDISDVLLASLLITPNLLGALTIRDEVSE